MPKRSFEPYGVRQVLRVVLSLVGVACFPAVAQDAAVPTVSGSADTANLSTGWRFVPRLGVGADWTNNLNLSATNRQSDYYATISPGFSFSGRSAAAFGSFSFDLNKETYARSQASDRTYLSGGGQGTLDLYERKLMVDVFANFSDERLSALNTASGTFDPNTQTHAQVVSVSPYARWQWSDRVNGELRYRATYSDATNSEISANLRHDFSLLLGSSDPRPLGWQVSAQDGVTEYKDAQSVRVTTSRGTLLYAVDPLLVLRGIAGYEQNNFANVYGNEQVIYGAGLTWNPSPRTRFSGTTEKRFFGHGYNYELAWRGPRSGISAVFSRDLSSTATTLNVSQLGSLFASYWLALESQIPDPVERAARVGELWRARGLPMTINRNTNYVSNQYFVDTRGQVSVSFTGVRLTVGGSVGYDESQRIVDPALLPPTDDLSRYGLTKQASASLYASYALTPQTQLSMGMGAGISRGAEGQAVPDAETRSKNFSVAANTELGKHVNGALSYSYVTSRGWSAYQQSLVGAHLGLHF